MDVHGAESLDATLDEMESHYLDAEHQVGQSADAAPQALPWSNVEELITTRSARNRSQRRKSFVSLRDMVAIVALLSFMLPLMKVSKQFCGPTKDKLESHLV